MVGWWCKYTVGGASMNGWRMRQEKTTVTRGTETESGTHDDWTSMDRMCGCMMYVWMKLESFLNAERGRERMGRE